MSSTGRPQPKSFASVMRTGRRLDSFQSDTDAAEGDERSPLHRKPSAGTTELSAALTQASPPKTKPQPSFHTALDSSSPRNNRKRMRSKDEGARTISVPQGEKPKDDLEERSETFETLSTTDADENDDAEDEHELEPLDGTEEDEGSLIAGENGVNGKADHENESVEDDSGEEPSVKDNENADEVGSIQSAIVDKPLIRKKRKARRSDMEGKKQLKKSKETSAHAKPKRETLKKSPPIVRDRPKREIKRPKRMEEELQEREDAQMIHSLMEKPHGTEDRIGFNDEMAYEEDERLVPVIIDPQSVNKGMAVLRNRAHAVRYHEWQLQCAQKEFDFQKERFRASHASTALADAKDLLTKFNSTVMRACNLIPDIILPSETASRYAQATDDLQTFVSDLEAKVDSKLTKSAPLLPEPPAAMDAEELLMTMKDAPAIVESREIVGSRDEEELVSQLVGMAKENRKQSRSSGIVRTSPALSMPGTMLTEGQRLSTAERRAKESETKQHKGMLKHPGSNSIEMAEAAARSTASGVLGEDFKPVPLSITPLKATADSVGLHSDEPLFKLRYRFPADMISNKVREQFSEAAQANQMKSLRRNFTVDEKTNRPDLPRHIETDIICLPPLSNMAGRLPACGLCGFIVKRDDYRGRAVKNGSTAPCLVHSYHAYCLAYLQEACNGICIAPLMGVASPCNLHERTRGGSAKDI